MALLTAQQQQWQSNKSQSAFISVNPNKIKNTKYLDSSHNMSQADGNVARTKGNIGLFRLICHSKWIWECSSAIYTMHKFTEENLSQLAEVALELQSIHGSYRQFDWCETFAWGKNRFTAHSPKNLTSNIAQVINLNITTNY